jgi:hypothetical protein
MANVPFLPLAWGHKSTIRNSPIQNQTRYLHEIKTHKVRNIARLSSFFTLIQYSFGIPSQRKKIRARNIRDLNQEGRSQSIPIFR